MSTQTNPADASPYNANGELVAMKEDIASRNYKITMKELLIGGAVLLAGIATGGALAAIAVPTMELLPVGLIAGGALGLFGGGAVANMATMKDRAKLKIDEDMVQSYMQGKNYWGEGYREEVAEHGYGGPRSPVLAQSPNTAKPAGRSV